jgi:peptidoglycan/xylan/chitin deacetylase (PgdA/CDA1 family)
VSALALTFDDGPDGEATPRLLDLLARHDAHASFFPIAGRAAAHPELVRRMLDEGHTVGLHCDEHVRHTDRDLEWGRRDTDRALEVLVGIGTRPTLWRTPWGQTAPWTDTLAAARRLRLVGWTADTHDWRGDTAEEMFAATHPALRAGAIVLAHDGLGPGVRRENCDETLRFVELAIRHAHEHGLKLEALG